MKLTGNDNLSKEALDKLNSIDTSNLTIDGIINEPMFTAEKTSDLIIKLMNNTPTHPGSVPRKLIGSC